MTRCAGTLWFPDVLKPEHTGPPLDTQETTPQRKATSGSAPVPEMQLNLNRSLSGAALGRLEDATEHIGCARTGLLPSTASVKGQHRMGN